jgi:hypothetical protein
MTPPARLAFVRLVPIEILPAALGVQSDAEQWLNRKPFFRPEKFLIGVLDF